VAKMEDKNAEEDDSQCLIYLFFTLIDCGGF